MVALILVVGNFWRTGTIDAFIPVSASLIGILGAVRIIWNKLLRFQIKMQDFLFALESIIVFIVIDINFQ